MTIDAFLIAQFTTYGEDIIAVTLPSQRPKLPYFCGSFPPSPPHFYKEYGPDYAEHYQWKVQPTTGAYTIEYRLTDIAYTSL